MKARIVTALALAALIALPACAGDPSPPARVTNYGNAPAAPRAPDDWGRGSPDGGATAQLPPSQPGAINWHTRLADAQMEARSTGRLILALSTKPRCSLCDKFKTRIAPANAGALNAVAVGYIYDITRPEVRRVDQTLRANLRGADLMPLVGFLTPDLQFVNGFWGVRSVSEFRSDIAKARARNPVRGARLPTTGRVEAPRQAVLNEFGEREWGRPGDIWPDGDPEPIDAITGAPDLAPAQPAPPMADTIAPRVIAGGGSPAGPASVGAGVPPPPATVADLPPLAVAPPAQPAASPVASSPWSAPAMTGPSTDQGTGAAAITTPVPAPEANPIAQPTPTPTAPKPQDDEAWGRDALKRALQQIRDGEFTAASETLAQVRTRLPETKIAREANKGGVALYNAKRIRLAANGTERTRYLTRARRDFSGSMWSVLFNS